MNSALRLLQLLCVAAWLFAGVSATTTAAPLLPDPVNAATTPGQDPGLAPSANQISSTPFLLPELTTPPSLPPPRQPDINANLLQPQPWSPNSGSPQQPQAWSPNSGSPQQPQPWTPNSGSPQQPQPWSPNSGSPQPINPDPSLPLPDHMSPQQPWGLNSGPSLPLPGASSPVNLLQLLPLMSGRGQSRGQGLSPLAFLSAARGLGARGPAPNPLMQTFETFALMSMMGYDVPIDFTGMF